MKGTVFIAWGGNRNLAQAVAAHLRKQGYSPEIGGDEKNPLQKDFYIGSQILKQLNRIPRAIILAQWHPEEDKIVETTTPLFRPNLMYEWGYLCARLLPAYLHVFLIGIQRKDLPSDLGGIWCEEIQLSNADVMAEAIVALFIQQVMQAPVIAMGAIEDWPTWKTWLIRQTSGEDAPDKIRLAAAIIHSIQPAYYYNELDFLHSLITDIGINLTTPPVLKKSREVAASASIYYKLTKNPYHKPTLGSLKSLQESLDRQQIDIVNTNTLDVWVEVIRNNFLGLCYRRMAESDEGSKFRKEYLQNALTSFLSTLELLDKMIPEAKESCWHLWHGYVYRNLGRVYSELDMKSKGQDALNKALLERKEVYADLQAKKVPGLLLTQLALEIALTEIDLIKHDYAESVKNLNEVVAMLKSNKPSIRPLIVWSKTLAQAKDVASKLKNADILNELTTLEKNFRAELSNG